MKSRIAELLEFKGNEIISASPRETVCDAAKRMNQHGIGALPVMDEGRLVGIFTERDVLARVVEGNRHAVSTRIEEVMTREPLCVGPATSIEDTMILITENRCRHIPVVEGERLVGLVSIGDLVRWQVRDQDVRLDAMLRSIRLAPG